MKRTHATNAGPGGSQSVFAFSSALICLLLAIGMAPSSSGAASSNIVVTMDVTSATEVSTAGCPTGDPARTVLGTVLPGTHAITTADCTVAFGSSNDTARLELTQFDGAGVAMYAPYPDARLDAGFGVGGAASLTESGELANAVYVDAQGRAVVMGQAEPGSSRRGGVWRFLDDGTLDPSFGTSPGFTAIDGTPHGNDPGYDGILEADETITVAGYGYASSAIGHAYVARLDADGDPITTFGGGDGIEEYFIGSYSTFHAIAPHPAGGWVAGGYRKESSDQRLLVARILANGQLDTSFGTGGSFQFERGTTGGGYQYEVIEDLHVLHDGRIVATGQVGANASSTRWITVGITAGGQLDTTGWNAPTGYWESSLQNAHGGWDILQQPDGKVVVAGSLRVAGNTRFVAMRHETDGSFDPGFGGGDGIADDGFGGASWERAYAVELTHDGKLLVGGHLDGLAAGNSVQVGLARLLPNGALDPSFGVGGTRAWPAGAGNENIEAMSLGADGKVLLAGEGNGDVVRVTRFDAEPLADYEAGTSDWATPNTSHFAVCMRDLVGANVNPGAGWLVDPGNDCTATVTDPWRPVARRSGDATATLAATTATGEVGSVVHLRFGARVGLAQVPGSYIAPVVFTTIAPAV